MKTYLFPSIRLTFICLVFFSGIYTTVVLAIAQLAPGHGKGEIITTPEGKAFYVQIAQNFSDDKYFSSRPSAVAYNAAGSGGSNKGPSNPAYLLGVQSAIDTFLVHNPTIQRSDIPADLVTSSGSGLDPHISVQAANVQVPRIARIRNIPEGNIRQLLLSNTENPLLGLFGPEKINVLKLNIALDELAKIK